MSAIPVLESGQSVLVAAAREAAPWRMVVDLVQGGHVTLATIDDEQIPEDWRDLTAVHMTYLNRFSVSLLQLPVIRVGTTRLVVGEPDGGTPIERRAYARVTQPIAAQCALLDGRDHTWRPFDGEVRDLGGGGCALVGDVLAPPGASLVLSLPIDDPPVVTVGRVLPREPLPTVGRVLLHVEFVLIREPDRDRILGFVLRMLAGQRRGNGS